MTRPMVVRLQIVWACVGGAALLWACAQERAVVRPAPAAPAMLLPTLKVLAVTRLPPLADDGGVVGGLSALVHDEKRSEVLALSDDKGEHGAPRLQRIHVSVGTTADGGVTLAAQAAGSIGLRQADGGHFPQGALDPEGLAVLVGGHLVVTSEGLPPRGVAPALLELGGTGRIIRQWRVPSRFQPRDGGGWGVQDNLGFEGASACPDGIHVLVATEGPLLQDRAPLARLLIFRVDGAEPVVEQEVTVALEHLDPDYRFHGVTSVLCADGAQSAYLLERAWSLERGFFIRVFAITLAGATNTSGLDVLRDDAGVVPVTKRLVLDPQAAGVPLDNYEGLAFGPSLHDGQRTLLMVSDDNFLPVQSTFLVLLGMER